jgi:hypothetical protein
MSTGPWAETMAARSSNCEAFMDEIPDEAAMRWRVLHHRGTETRRKEWREMSRGRPRDEVLWATWSLVIISLSSLRLGASVVRNADSRSTDRERARGDQGSPTIRRTGCLSSKRDATGQKRPAKNRLGGRKVSMPKKLRRGQKTGGQEGVNGRPVSESQQALAGKDG